MPRGGKSYGGGGGRSNWGGSSNFSNLPDYGFSNQKTGRGYGGGGGNQNSRNFSSDNVWANTSSNNNYSNYGSGGGGGLGGGSSYGNNSYGQNPSANSGYSNNYSNWDNYGQARKANGNNPDDLLKELGKCFLNSFSGDASNSNMMGFMQGNQSGGGGGAFGNNPSRYDGYYNNANQYQAFGYQGGYGQRNPNYNRDRFMGSNAVGFRKYNQVRGVQGNKNVRGGKKGGGPVTGKQGGGGGQANKQSLKPKGKGAKTSMFKRLKDRFKFFANNKFVGEDNIPLVLFLRTIFGDLTVESDKDHCLLISRFLFRHSNAIKLLTYECKLALDKKFGQECTDEIKNKKLDYLKAQKKTMMADFLKIKKFKEDGKMAEKEKIIEDTFDVLTGEKFTNDNVPKPEDYVTATDKTQTDFAIDFQFCFIKNCYDKFNIRIFDPYKSKNNESRLKFHLNNGFVPLLIIEKVKSKSHAPMKFPAVLSKYAKECSKDVKEKMEATNKLIMAKVVANKELVQSDVSDYIGNEKLSTEVLRDFADCIILFDKVASVIKYKLLNYTLYINLPKEIKESIFTELVNTIYTECLNNLKSGARLNAADKTYEDMEKPQGEEDAAKKEGGAAEGESNGVKMDVE